MDIRNITTTKKIKMSLIMKNEQFYNNFSYNESEINFGTVSESDSDKIDVYKKYLNNINYTGTTNISIIIRNYARMLFSENSSIFLTNVTKTSQQDIQSQQVFNIPSFDVTKSEVILILLTVVYIIIFITGILGNVVTCIVIAKNKSMHTAVNYYLFSLAVSDLLLLISGKSFPS